MKFIYDQNIKVMARKTFYVCSYGGCGSKMLCQALQKHGSVKHIHSRNPPNKLEYVNSTTEWFNGNSIPEIDIPNYYVIFIYKNPIHAIFSRFTNPNHLLNIQTDSNTKVCDVLTSSKDLYGIAEFYNNYTTPNSDRNYKIYCVKYEKIFEKQHELSNMLGIGELNLVKRETNRQVLVKKLYAKLYTVYKDLIETMNANDFIMVR